MSDYKTAKTSEGHELHYIAAELNELQKQSYWTSEQANRALQLIVEAANIEKGGRISDFLVAHYNKAIELANMPIKDFAKLVEEKGRVEVEEQCGATKNGMVVMIRGTSEVYTGKNTADYKAGVLPAQYIFPQMIAVVKWKFRQLDIYRFALREEISRLESLYDTDPAHA